MDNNREPGTKIKILIINPMDRTYGSTHRLRRFIQGFRNDKKYLCEYIEPNSELPYAVNFRQKNNLLGFLSGTFRRAFFALSKDYDILFTQTVTVLTVLPMLIARLKNKKILVDWDDLSWMLQRGAFRSFLVRFCEHHFLCIPDVVFVPNHYLARYGLMHGARNMVYASHGIDMDLFNPRVYDNNFVRGKFSIPRQHLILGYLASFTTGGVMDLDFIFLCMQEILNKYPSVSFVVIGGGPLFEKYLKLAKKINLPNTYFTGWLSQDRVPHYLAGIDIGLIFMRENNANKYKTSLKVAEYLAMHKPVIGHLVGETLDNFGKFCELSGANKDSFKEKIEQGLEKVPYCNWEEVDSFLKVNYTWEKSIGLVKNSIEQIYEHTTVKSSVSG